MRALLRSDLTWLLLGGFALGTLGVVAFHPASTAPLPVQRLVQTQRTL